MIRYSFLYMSFVCMYFIEAPAFSQYSTAHPSYSPSIQIPDGLGATVFSGGGGDPKKKINCYTVLYEMPGYQNAQAQGACYEAQTACVRLGLIQQFLQQEKKTQFSQLYPGGEFSQAELKSHVDSTLVDVKIKLMGCVLAASASIVTDSVIDQAGFVPPAEDKQDAAFAIITSAPLDAASFSSPKPSQESLPQASGSSSESSLNPLPPLLQDEDPLPPLNYSCEQEQGPPKPPQPI